ncbi:hypothetical protein ACKKBG_A30415 [Auxenochlorella protothecoides x Auxenochlorella symbiontica]
MYQSTLCKGSCQRSTGLRKRFTRRHPAESNPAAMPNLARSRKCFLPGAGNQSTLYSSMVRFKLHLQPRRP